MNSQVSSFWDHCGTGPGEASVATVRFVGHGDRGAAGPNQYCFGISLERWAPGPNSGSMKGLLARSLMVHLDFLKELWAGGTTAEKVWVAHTHMSLPSAVRLSQRLVPESDIAGRGRSSHWPLWRRPGIALLFLRGLGYVRGVGSGRCFSL